MLRTGKEFLAGLNDGRTVYIGGLEVRDVTAHPAFSGAARTLAGLFDYKADPANGEPMAFGEDGERYSSYYLMPRTPEDLVKRSRAHYAIAAKTYGLFGRSPDHVASFVTGLAMNPEILDRDGDSFSANITAYYEHLRNNDLYATYAVHPAPQSKNEGLFGDTRGYQAVLQVVGEDDSGVILNGMKMLATAGVFCDEVWIGNLTPISDEKKKEAITCAVPMNAEGLALWVRKPMELYAETEFDSPLASNFDESDVMLIFDEVRVPWERVFVHDRAALSREIYIETASHTLGNHQSNVRFHAKLRFIAGIIHKMTQSAGVDRIPAVAEKLGRLAAWEAALGGMIQGQIQDFEDLGNGYVNFNRRYMYAALNWCQEHYPEIVGMMRELAGGSVFQMPADISVLENPATRGIFRDYWAAGDESAVDRVKLYRLAWDMYGSEFGSRQQQYENFFAGPSFIVRNHSFREAPWGSFDGMVERFMDTIRPPGTSRKDQGRT